MKGSALCSGGGGEWSLSCAVAVDGCFVSYLAVSGGRPAGVFCPGSCRLTESTHFSRLPTGRTRYSVKGRATLLICAGWQQRRLWDGGGGGWMYRVPCHVLCLIHVACVVTGVVALRVSQPRPRPRCRLAAAAFFCRRPRCVFTVYSSFTQLFIRRTIHGSVVSAR